MQDGVQAGLEKEGGVFNQSHTAAHTQATIQGWLMGYSSKSSLLALPDVLSEHGKEDAGLKKWPLL